MPHYVLRHFKLQDPLLYDAARTVAHEIKEGPTEVADLFSSLCRTIVGQQLSNKAARAIWSRFRSLFPRNKPAARRIVALHDHELRAAGLSYAKIASLRDLSERIVARSLRLNQLRNAPEALVRAELLQVRGIGPWSCEMFMMFALGHEDVFSPGDLALQKSIQEIYQLPVRPTKPHMDELSQAWAPYRTYASCALWHFADTK